MFVFIDSFVMTRPYPHKEHHDWTFPVRVQDKFIKKPRANAMINIELGFFTNEQKNQEKQQFSSFWNWIHFERQALLDVN